MLRKINLLLITLSAITMSFSQSQNVYQIAFEKAMVFSKGEKAFKSDYIYKVYIDSKKSIFDIKNKFETKEVLVEDKNNENNLIYNPQGKNITLVFKDYIALETFSKHEVAFKYFVVKDKLDVFEWDILEETKEILSYNCQKAIMEFRGRNYTAWFAADLPVGGPWKYDGLPGMILEIKSDDNFIAFTATDISNSIEETDEIKIPFVNTKKLLTFEEYKNLYKKKAIELLSYKMNENSQGIESSRGGIEFYISKDDIEYTKALEAFRKQ